MHLCAQTPGASCRADAGACAERDYNHDHHARGLWFGAQKSTRRAAVRREVDAFLEPFEVLLFDREAADAYARIRFDLERVGRPIGERDLLIASIALARDLTVVTHNRREFACVSGLKVEDWL